MLPNWLYGKSLRKLQEILNSGGQTAAGVSYSNTESGLEATNAQTAIDEVVEGLNTKVGWDDYSQLGAVNRLNWKTLFNGSTSGSIQGINYSVRDGVVTLNNSNTGTTYFTSNKFTLPKGTYKFVCDEIKQSAAHYSKIQLFRADNNVNLAILFGSGWSGQDINVFTISEDLEVEAEIVNNYTLGVSTFSNFALYPMITLSSYNGPYVPYAMTNKKLTDKLTADANLGAAVNLSSYTAYSNLYTAPSDGYVHFVSAASGSTARTIYTYGNNTTAATDPHFTHSTSANNKAFEIFIKKGLKVYIDGLQSGDTINFYPLS